MLSLFITIVRFLGLQDLLGSPLVLVEEPILLYSSSQEPPVDQIQALGGHIERGGRHRRRLGNPAVLCQNHPSRPSDQA